MPQIGEEVILKRTKNAKHFYKGLDTKGNEKYQAVIQQGQHYQSDDGSFQDVDNNLVDLGGEVLDAETNEHFTHRCEKIDLPVAFNKFKQPIKLGKGAEKILIKPLGCNQVTGTATGNKVTYVDAYNNVDVVRFAFADGYGESYTLKAAGHPTRFEFDVPVGKELLQQWLGHNCIDNGIDDIRMCEITWTATGFYFDLPDLTGLTYPIEVK